MLYVLIEIWIWVAAAALVGALFGWWLRSIRAAREVAREALLWQQRVRHLKRCAVRPEKAAEDHGNRNDSDGAGA